MASTFHGLELGKRGLYAQQAALSTTGHNIANANTEGYTRQRAEMQATNAIPYPGMAADRSPAQLGTGVEVNKIVRLREDYLDTQYRGENKNQGYWEAKTDTLTKIEEIINEPTDTGLSHVMDEFWAGWQELAKDPSNAAARSVVRQKGVAVAETFNYFANSLTEIKTDLENVITTKVNEVNSLVKQIASLNGQIARIVPNNYEPNDLYDQRDLLIDKLSKIVDVKVENPNKNTGTVDIRTGDQVVVSAKDYTQLKIDDDFNKITLINPDGSAVNDLVGNAVELTLADTGGELKGRIEAYNEIVPNIEDQINELVAVFAGKVNAIHSIGYDLNGVGGTKDDGTGTGTMVPNGIDFFSFTAIDSAKSLKVNDDIMNSLEKIAAAKSENASGGTSTGNGKNAQAIADIKFSSLDFVGVDTTPDDYYRNIIGQLGIDSQEAQRMQNNSKVIINQVENRRQSVSGVSLDEEMSNMIRFQQAYNASARVVTTMDECLEKIINGMGRVGL